MDIYQDLVEELVKWSTYLSRQVSDIWAFGNISARYKDAIIIKASGVSLNEIKSTEFVLAGSGEIASDSNLSPSTDTDTHLELYDAFPEVCAIVHTHSLYAISWAQSGQPIPCLGTTHADYWCGEIPITRELTTLEINGEYEKETGRAIVETIQNIGMKSTDLPGVLVARHGPFTWGTTVEQAVRHAELLEYVAKAAYITCSLNSSRELTSLSQIYLDRHFTRKHGSKAYYGQG